MSGCGLRKRNFVVKRGSLCSCWWSSPGLGRASTENIRQAMRKDLNSLKKSRLQGEGATPEGQAVVDPHFDYQEMAKGPWDQPGEASAPASTRGLWLCSPNAGGLLRRLKMR